MGKKLIGTMTTAEKIPFAGVLRCVLGGGGVHIHPADGVALERGSGTWAVHPISSAGIVSSLRLRIVYIGFTGGMARDSKFIIQKDFEA
jgi:hypothetical protein